MAALDKLEGFACRPRYGILGYRYARDCGGKGYADEHTANARRDLEA